MTRLSLICLSFFVGITPALAELKVAGLFGDHAVLQQGIKVPIWGTAAPGTEVEISYRGQVKTGKADEKGNWKIWLDPLAAGEGEELAITGDGQLILRDVAVGEVWFAAGQSNMEMPFNSCENAAGERALVDEPGVRMMKVERKTTLEPETETTGRWYRMAPNTVGGMSGAAYYFAKEVHHATRVPVGIIQSTWGGSPVEAWMRKESLDDPSSAALKKLHEQYEAREARYPAEVAAHEEKLRRWEAEKTAKEAEGAKFTTPRPEAPYGPGSSRWKSALYNGMVNPVIPYAIRGVIWYQGEANSASHAMYTELFSRMIQDWRSLWGQGEFPFLYVQLPNWLQSGQPGNLWAYTREAQEAVLEVPNTGMIVTIDIGDPKDVHPKNKKEVGRRLSLLARNKVYGEAIPAESPKVAECRFAGKEAIVHFKNAETLRWLNGRTDGFEVAGKDGRYVPAEAKLSGGEVILTAPTVAEPAMVRYAWANNPEAILVNEHGLPAAPYRSHKEK